MREFVKSEDIDIYSRKLFSSLGHRARLPNFFSKIEEKTVAVIETDDITDEDIIKITELYKSHSPEYHLDREF